MLHDYMDAHTSPGRRSAGYTSGRERQSFDHASKYDRNVLLYAMLEIKLSLGGDEPHGLSLTPYDTLAMHDRICGGGADNQLYRTGAGPAGWRAATHDTDSPTYEVQVDANAFAPVVAMGSLETLQSMRATTLASCPSGINEEDPVHLLACEEGETSVLQDLVTRQSRAPFYMQRDVWCNANVDVSIESAVGNPFYFDEDLYDTSIKQRYDPNTLRGVDDMRVPAQWRGEEKMDEHFRKRSLMAWVYVTSSGGDYRAGMYRLLDLPVFRGTPCDELPGVSCSSSTVLNANGPLLDTASQYKTGREALPLHRCSGLVQDVFPSIGAACHKNVYAAVPGCVTQSLALASEPTYYGADHWVRLRLATVPRPSPPPPPSPPPRPPPPPPPSPPPSPPTRVGQFEIMRQVRDIEERVCTSVYYLSTAARCERLALDLTGRIYYGKLSPPGSPPAGPYEPPPPPPPPQPSLPEGLLSTLPRTALLSTNRVPAQGLDAGDGFFTSNHAALLAGVVAVAADERACVAGAPLYCNTGSLPDRCLNAGRACGTADANGRDPWVEFTWPHMPDRYLWAIRLTLPPNAQLSRLLVGPKELRLYGPRGEPVPCAEGDEQVFDATTGEVLTIVCQPGGWEPEQLWALGGAHRARLTLKGEFRQLWLAGIEVVERSYASAGIGRRPPPPPAPPAGPPVG
jgi:hypothetical protein